MSPDGQNQNISGKNTRREARELALRMLYQIELGHQPMDEVIEAAFAQSQLDGKNRTFADEVVRGTIEHQKEIDGRLSQLAVEWATERQAVVDRNILRLAAYEMLYRPDSPVAAVVNEAVELAKKYSTSESGRFVNGVLGALARQPRGEAAQDSKEGDEAAQDADDPGAQYADDPGDCGSDPSD